MRARRPVLAAALLVIGAVSTLPAQGTPHGVFLRLADGPAGARPQMVAALPDVMTRAGWTVVTRYDVGAGACRHGATVFVVQAPDYARAVLQQGARAAFALPLRLAVYEDDGGTHLALANPLSLGRTIVAESFEAPAREAVEALRRALEGGFPGTLVQVEYGQLRDRGLIGKTMGIVAGGPFPEKIEEAASVTGRSVADVAAAIARAGAAPTGKWGLHVVYRVPLEGHDAELVGVTGAKMEAKAFEIVGEGGDAARKGWACPGLDHAAAFPVELLVVREGKDVKVLLVDEMFRMKMYFEDAGRMKFAANMQMPGSIEDELRDLVEEAL